MVSMKGSSLEKPSSNQKIRGKSYSLTKANRARLEALLSKLSSLLVLNPSCCTHSAATELHDTEDLCSHDKKLGKFNMCLQSIIWLQHNGLQAVVKALDRSKWIPVQTRLQTRPYVHIKLKMIYILESQQIIESNSKTMHKWLCKGHLDVELLQARKTS